MAKIILSKGDNVLREIVLCKERVTIGRRPYNDIVLEDLAISGEHAVIVTRNGDSFLEDLNSTNGTQVNGQPVRMHFLQDEDVIELAQFRIRYLGRDGAASDKNGNLLIHDVDRADLPGQIGRIKVLNGPNAGKEIVLAKALTTLGRPGVQVAVVTQTGRGYFLAHVEGRIPMLNDRTIGSDPQLMSDGDVIDLSGTKMQLRLT